MILNIFLYTYFLFVYLSWYGVCSYIQILELFSAFAFFVMVLRDFALLCFVFVYLLPVIYEMGVFSKSVNCLFCFLDGISYREENFNLNEVQLINYFLIDCISPVVSKESLLNPRSSKLPPYWYSRISIVFNFICRSVIHFELISLKGMSTVIYFFNCMASSSRIVYWKNYVIWFASLSKISRMTVFKRVYFSTPMLFYLHLSLFFAQYHIVLITVNLHCF